MSNTAKIYAMTGCLLVTGGAIAYWGFQVDSGIIAACGGYIQGTGLYGIILDLRERWRERRR